MRPETPNGVGTDGVWRITIPPSAGVGNLFCKIPGLEKRFGAIYFRLLKHDRHLLLVVCAATFAMAATGLGFYFQTPVVLGLFVLLMIPAFRAGRYYLNDVRHVGADSPFQLYLRAFVSDIGLSLTRRYRNVPLTAGMGRNVRAIGSPQDSFPLNLGFNVSMVSSSNEEWQEVVLGMLRHADYIWIRCGLHAWVQWELRKVLALRAVRHVGFILPAESKEEVWKFVLSVAGDSEAFRRLGSLDVSHVLVVCFTSSGMPVVVQSQRNSADDYLPALYAARFAMLLG